MAGKDVRVTGAVIGAAIGFLFFGGSFIAVVVGIFISAKLWPDKWSPI